jgi:hypothetical protein
MCCSLTKARFSKTIGAAWEILPNLHALGYQNQAQHLGTAGGGNAMILPIPAVPGTLTPKSLLDTRKCKGVLETMELYALWHLMNFSRSSDSLGRGAKRAEPVIFDFDVYQIVLATSAFDIPDVLDQVNPDKRPPLKKSIFNSYGRWYPDWYIAVCCFNNRDLKKAAPLIWTYQPKQLFVPGLDAHDGKSPKLNVKVDTDHSVIVGSYRMEPGSGQPVNYNDVAPEVLPYLPKMVNGGKFETPQDQGDWFFSTLAVAAGKFEPQRQLPPGAKKKSA